VSTPLCTAPNASGPPLLRRSAHRGALADAVISTSRAISPTFRTSRPAEATRTTKFITNGPSGWAMIWSSKSCSPTSSKSLGAQAHCCSGPTHALFGPHPNRAVNSSPPPPAPTSGRSTPRGGRAIPNDRCRFHCPFRHRSSHRQANPGHRRPRPVRAGYE